MKKQSFLICLLSISLLFGIKAPIAIKLDHQINAHELNWNDPYFYMKEKESLPLTMKYLKQENKYTQKMSKQFSRLHKEIYSEMLSKMNDEDVSVPYKKGPWMYYYQTVKDKAYGVNYRINTLTHEKQILIDENKLAGNNDFFSLGTFSVSHDQNLLAYSVDYEGSENYTLYVKDIKTDKCFSEIIPNVDEMIWLKDNKTILYVVHDEQYRSNRLYKHILGTNPKQDVLLKQENDEAFYLSVYLSRDKEYVFLSSSSKTTCENWFMSAVNTNDELKPFLSKKENIEYYPEHFNQEFYAFTNEKEANYQYFKLQNTDNFDNAQLLFSGDKRIVLNEVLHFDKFFVISERIEGENRIRVINKLTNQEFNPDIKHVSYSLTIGSNPESNSDSLRLEFDAMTIPAITYSFNLLNRELKILKQHNPRGLFDSNLYEEKLLMVKTKDNQDIPLNIIYRKDMIKESNPCLLYAYGAYGSSEDPYFSSSRLSLLDRGWIYAVAHIRGGGEYGKAWHNQGRLLNRKNTFQDFIDCADYLVNEKYTNSELLCINAGSAGGMLIGAVINQRPELFKAAVADVPFVDVLNTMMDSSIALTVPEYEEWGNPANKEYFDYIRSYSPYDNIKAQSYPNLLINAGFKDSRVMYWEPLKWIAKLREFKTDNHVLLLNMNMNEGHSGSGDRFVSINEYAFTYAFLIWIIGQ